MLRLNLPNDALTSLRFTYSPLVELTTSYRVLRGNWERGTYWRWLEEAQQAISDLELPYMDNLITPGHLVKGAGKAVPKGYIPDFLTPTPECSEHDIEQEFLRLQNLSVEIVQACIQELILIVGPNDLLCDFLAYPAEGMQALILELREYWKRTLAHHWHRMMAVLENDILYNSRILTLNGIETLMPNINTLMGYDAGAITLDWSRKDCEIEQKKKHSVIHKPDRIVDISSDKFHLVPVIFAANGVYYQVTEPWQPMILYTPRGAGLWNYETPDPPEALELVMGAGKSRILVALETPFSTGELAQKLSLTAGAVSQQLGKLHQAGLVESHRSGKHVFYRLSQRGTQLVNLF